MPNKAFSGLQQRDVQNRLLCQARLHVESPGKSTSRARALSLRFTFYRMGADTVHDRRVMTLNEAGCREH